MQGMMIDCRTDFLVVTHSGLQDIWACGRWKDGMALIEYVFYVDDSVERISPGRRRYGYPRKHYIALVT